MNKTRLLLILFLIVIVSVSISGCASATVKTGVEYTEYVFDEEAKDFVRSDYKLSFIDDFSGYRMSFGNLAVMGKATKYLSGYTLNVSDDVLESLSGLDDSISSDPDRYQDVIDAIKSVTVNQNVYLSGDVIFTHSSIVMTKDSASTGDYGTLEGKYEYTPDSSIKYLLKDGYVYVIKVTVENNKTFEKQDETPSMRYTIQDRIVKFVRIDSNGNDVYLENKLQFVCYMLATISYPTDFSASLDTTDSKTLEKAKLLDGKTLSVLTKSYYKK